VDNQRRSRKSLSVSPSPHRIPLGKAPDSLPCPSTVASRRQSESGTQNPSAPPVPLRQLGRPLREGERQLLTVLADECVREMLLLGIEADKKEEPAKQIHHHASH